MSLNATDQLIEQGRRAWQRFRTFVVVIFAACFVLTLAITAQDTAAQESNDKPAADTDAQATPDEPVDENAPAEEEKKEEPLPTLEEMQPLSVEQLMKGPAEDWIVLKAKDQVLVVQPVDPRPNTLEFLADRLKYPDKYEPKSFGLDEEGKPLAGDALDKAKRIWRKTLVYLEVHMPFNKEDISEDADRKFLIPFRVIKEIIYFEDLMLKQIDIFLDQKKISEAYEMVVVLRKRNPKWPGLEFREEGLLFAESARLVDEQKFELALVDLEQLHERNPEYPGLSDTTANVADLLIKQAETAEDFRRARHFLERLKARFPQHRTVTRWTDTLTARTAALMQEAQAAESAGEIEKALASVETAALVWPNTPGLRTLYGRLARRHQRLHVGVILQPREVATPLNRTVADDRQRELTQSTLFEPDYLDEQIVRYRSRFLNEWEPTNLGRRIRFQLRPYRQSWESQPVTVALPMIRQLSDKMQTDSQNFDERLSDRISSVAQKSPFVFDVEFENVPLRPEPLFSYALSGPGSFEMGKRDERSITYRRAIPEQPDDNQYHIAEVVEVQYDTPQKAIQGLLRGQVDMLPQIPLRDVDILSELSSFFVQKYQLPKTHLVQFNNQNKVLRSRALRRAMAACLDNQRLLEEFVLKSPPNGKGRLTSAPFPQTSYAYDTAVLPQDYDIELALALSIAARKELGGALPKLSLRAPPDPESRIIAKQLIAAWARIGLEVTLVEDDGTVGEDDWDLAYRIISMHEPAVELWPLLAGKETAEIADLKYLPNWLRQKLVELDRVSDWSRAENLLHGLHRDMAAEAQVIPLFEVDEYLIVRKTVRGVPEAPISTYDGIEQWVVQPWYPKK